jgi:hypothetical protein
MRVVPRNIDIEPAVTDFRNRTLSRLPGDFSRLVYLASSRDCNSGQYYHDGLAFHFGQNVASRAMAICHREIFDRLVYASLEELIEELRNYISSTDEQPEKILKSWKHLGSYRVTIPSECDELEAEVFLSDIKMALAILQTRQKRVSQDEQSA